MTRCRFGNLLGIYLNRQGYSVSTAASGTEALKQTGQSHIDLVVLDIGLAGEDGLNVLGVLKSRHPQTKVVMLTGMGFVEDLLQEAQERGADGYVSKVLPLDELLLTIHRYSAPFRPGCSLLSDIPRLGKQCPLLGRNSPARARESQLPISFAASSGLQIGSSVSRKP